MQRKSIIKIALFLTGVTCWVTYVYIRKPNLEKIEQSLSSKFTGTETPDQQSYDSLIRVDIANKKTFPIGSAARAEMWDRSFPFRKYKFDFDQTERILAVLNDSATYDWGELGTPHYDKNIIFYGKDSEVIGYTIVSFDGQTRSFPMVALTKWGLLSDKGYRDLLTAIRTD